MVSYTIVLSLLVFSFTATLLRILWRYRRCIINLDTSPLLVLAVVEGQPPATLILWCT